MEGEIVARMDQDGPAYFPVVAILSLGSPAVMNFTPHSRLRESSNTGRNTAEDSNSDKVAVYTETDVSLDTHQPSSILLMPCSLLIFKDEAYSDYLHGIEDSSVHQLDKAVNIVEVASMASLVKQQRSALDKRIMKISELGVPV